jgi:hypothetical protein
MMASTLTSTSNPAAYERVTWCPTCQAAFKDFWKAEEDSIHVHHKSFSDLYDSAVTHAFEACLCLFAGFFEKMRQMNLLQLVQALRFTSEFPGLRLPDCTTYRHGGIMGGGREIEMKFNEEWAIRIMPREIYDFKDNVHSTAVPVDRDWDRLRGFPEPENWFLAVLAGHRNFLSDR